MLMPCPQCLEGEGELDKIYNRYGPDEDACIVQCKKCGYEAPGCYAPDNRRVYQECAITKWNNQSWLAIGKILKRVRDVLDVLEKE